MFCFIHHITHQSWICLKIYSTFPSSAYFFIHSTVQSRRMSCLSCLIGFFCFHCQNSIPNLQHLLDISKLFVRLKTHTTKGIAQKYVYQNYRVIMIKMKFCLSVSVYLTVLHWTVNLGVIINEYIVLQNLLHVIFVHLQSLRQQHP